MELKDVLWLVAATGFLVAATMRRRPHNALRVPLIEPAVWMIVAGLLVMDGRGAMAGRAKIAWPLFLAAGEIALGAAILAARFVLAAKE